jgi:hypothetical protein
MLTVTPQRHESVSGPHSGAFRVSLAFSPHRTSGRDNEVAGRTEPNEGRWSK